MTTEPTSVPPTSGGETSRSSEPEETGRVTEWVVLTFDASGFWNEHRGRLTAPTRREAERDALKLAAPGEAVSVVPARSWGPVVEEPPTEPRVVPFDRWAGA